MQRGRLVVVANRLPVSVVSPDAVDDWKTSPGGLVSALAPILQAHDGAWIGWTGHPDHEPAPFGHDGIHLVPTRMSAAEFEDHYLGFSNSTLWPLYHDAVRWPEFHRHWWRPYRAVNRRFAERAAHVAQPGDQIWVQDYHLQLVPEMLRELRPDVRIGFFLHIPFPPPELLAQIPWRREILTGLLGADLVGFQTPDGARNFLEAVRQFLGLESSGESVEWQGRRVDVRDFPISIDVEKFETLARNPAVQARAQALRADLGGRRILLGVDRLDYTKGIHHRLRAFETLLARDPTTADRVTFLQIAVPSRGLVPEYADMRERIERLVGRINGESSRGGQVPVHYHHTNLEQEDLVAHYLAADVMCVTPLRDGMNLVAKEYPVTRVDERGVLILSEFAGAANELHDALLVNPHDLDGMADAYTRALDMPPEEQSERMRRLRGAVGASDVHAWALSFLEALAA
ncbi:MAG: alpha,alpha-trehalose-phosphate synthase (UDP-forming) [Planctomycetota bacterium]